MKLLLSMFAYPFIVRAFVVGILVSLCASLLGVPLVLKRYSMIGDGLSHVSFGALSVAVACGFAPLWFSIPVVVIAAFILMHVAEKSRVSADAMILSVLTALTVVLGMRMMGAMLLSSLIIFPALSAMRVFKSFRSVVCFAAGLSVMCFCLGLTGSYLLSTPVGATVVVCDLAAFLLCCLIGRGRG